MSFVIGNALTVFAGFFCTFGAGLALRAYLFKCVLGADVTLRSRAFVAGALGPAPSKRSAGRGACGGLRLWHLAEAIKLGSTT